MYIYVVLYSNIRRKKLNELGHGAFLRLQNISVKFDEDQILGSSTLYGKDSEEIRNLLYTAVTRAKKMLIIVGNQMDVNKMIEKQIL